jgi:anaerobic ribonucleoside-triphosphate reductase activating protein
MPGTLINLNSWRDSTEVEGPGKRFALWVQGCTIRCPGCCNPHMHPLEPREIVETDEVMRWILASRESCGIEGATFLGGEPMLQARGLAAVAEACRREGLSVVVFSGYTLEAIRQTALPGSADLLASTDLLIDGPYVREQPETERNWAGSRNQRFHFFTQKYRPGIEFDPAFRHGFEIRFERGGFLGANGWPVELGEPEPG